MPIVDEIEKTGMEVVNAGMVDNPRKSQIAAELFSREYDKGKNVGK